MKPMVSGLLAVLLASVVSAPQAADGRERNINQRQHHQLQRNHQGVRQGDLTRGEVRRDGERRFNHDRRHPGFDRGHGYGHASTRAFDRRVDHIQHSQRQRIEQGVRSGELTRREARRLMAEQRAIEAEERRYLADGILTQWERRDLVRDLNVASRHIYNETHDAQARR